MQEKHVFFYAKASPPQTCARSNLSCNLQCFFAHFQHRFWSPKVCPSSTFTVGLMFTLFWVYVGASWDYVGANLVLAGVLVVLLVSVLVVLEVVVSSLMLLVLLCLAYLGACCAVLGFMLEHLGTTCWGYVGVSWPMLAHLGIMLGVPRFYVGPSWLYLGAILWLCWVLLGRLGPMLAQLGTMLGVPGFYVGPSWLYLGAILGLCWVLLGRLGPMLAQLGTMLGVPGFYVGPSWLCVGLSWGMLRDAATWLLAILPKEQFLLIYNVFCTFPTPILTPKSLQITLPPPTPPCRRKRLSVSNAFRHLPHYLGVHFYQSCVVSNHCQFPHGKFACICFCCLFSPIYPHHLLIRSPSLLVKLPINIHVCI